MKASDDSQVLRLAGDQLVAEGRYEEAAACYRAALETARTGRAGLLTREGLAASKDPEAGLLTRVLRAIEPMGPHVFVGAGIATWRKHLPFFEDARFRELASRHAHLLPAPNWHWNLHVVLWAAGQARNVEGDLVELGVFKGHTTRFCADYLAFSDWPKTWWLYDTFEGIPEDQQDEGWDEINANLYAGSYSEAEVRERFADLGNVRIVRGRIPEALDKEAPERIAFLHIDLNNAAAEVGALDRLFDRVSPGGVIVFDDYLWQAARAQLVAERAWFAARGLEVLALPTGQGLFLKR